MDDTRFPSQIPGVIGGKTFLQIFTLCPKIIEFVDSLWTPDKTTGVYKLFYTWVKNHLAAPDSRAQHELRCARYVKTEKHLPSYMRKYVVEDTLNKTI